MKATWEDKIIAESDKTVVVEGNHYFPPESIKREYLAPSDTHSTCPWKGIASYYHVRVGDRSNQDAAWSFSGIGGLPGISGTEPNLIMPSPKNSPPKTVL